MTRVRLITWGVLSPWGITARLMIAFVGVAVLAAAANFIVEQGAAIVVPGQRRAELSAATTEGTLAATPASEISSTPVLVSADGLLQALERFDQSVLAAVDSSSPEALARHQLASKALDRAALSFSTESQAIANRSFPELQAALKQHQTAALDWIEHAKTRRQFLKRYSESLERMNTRANEPLDGAFKILGRVVARQSLVDVDSSLDALRDNYAASMRTGTITTAAGLQSLAGYEAAFANTLEKNRKGLERSAGEIWFKEMELEFHALVDLRAGLERTQHELATLGPTFVQQTTRLAKAVPKTMEAPSLTVEEQLPAAALAATPANTHAAPIAPHAPATPAQQRKSSRLIVAWVSVSVLVLLLVISIATVRSIVLPVRRLMEATSKIASGQPSGRVPRGGIKELDALTIAFNDMADQLAVAQASTTELQQRLEAKVIERTRQLQQLAELDPLTGLPNRRHLFTLLNARLDRAKRENRHVGVFFLDVDNFKTINDSSGHAFGDRVLRGIAARLRSSARALGFAARLGGDEFTIVCDNAVSLEEINAAGEKIMRAFQTPIEIDGRDLIVSISVGASIYPDHAQNAEALLVAADAALFNAKSLGRSRLSMFTPDLLEKASTKFTIEQGLRKAIERNEFELFFQPEISGVDLQTHMVEALVRWRMPDGRYVPPGEFLAVAEESGLIIEISDWVLRTAIRTTAEWHRGAWPQARVAINVSPRQLLDYRFVDRVQELLTEFALPPDCIEIELTESVLQTGPSTIEQLHRLRAIGVAIALDDFGTGYSSLASLEQLPLTRVKLDRSLIQSIHTNARSSAIVGAIVGLCNGLGLEITAEGIENAEQFEKLLSYRNLSLQGYFLARPAPAQEIFAAMSRATDRAQDFVLLSRLLNNEEKEGRLDAVVTLQRSATA